MKLFRATLRSALAAVVVLAPAALRGQGPTSTGAGQSPGDVDSFWMAALNGGAYLDAFVLNRDGGLTGSGFWMIDVSPTGSVPGGAPDGNYNREQYSYMTTFTGGGLTSVFFRCAVDDPGTIQIVLNGNVVAGGSCDGYIASTVRTLTGFDAGTNTLVFNTSGNGITDGFIFDVTRTEGTVTPEPGPLALFATGLIAVCGVARRRRRSTQG